MQPHATPDEVCIILFARGYKHDTPPALGGGESLRARQRQSGQELEHLFNSLMQRTFRGELVGEQTFKPEDLQLAKKQNL